MCWTGISRVVLGALDATLAAFAAGQELRALFLRGMHFRASFVSLIRPKGGRYPTHSGEGRRTGLRTIREGCLRLASACFPAKGLSGLGRPILRSEHGGQRTPPDR